MICNLLFKRPVRLTILILLVVDDGEKTKRYVACSCLYTRIEQLESTR